MGAGNSRVAAATRTAFSELDQSALYASAQAVKSQGHKGLGSKSAKLKASQWQGRKVSFDSDEVCMIHLVQINPAIPVIIHRSFPQCFMRSSIAYVLFSVIAS